MATQSKVIRPTVRAEPKPKGSMRTLTVMIPRSYNADSRGMRRPVELSKFVRTMHEIRSLFSGYSVQPAFGWYRDRLAKHVVMGISDLRSTYLLRRQKSGIGLVDSYPVSTRMKKRSHYRQ